MHVCTLLLQDELRNAHVRAKTRMRLLVLTKGALEAVFREFPQVCAVKARKENVGKSQSCMFFCSWRSSFENRMARDDRSGWPRCRRSSPRSQPTLA